MWFIELTENVASTLATLFHYISFRICDCVHISSCVNILLLKFDLFLLKGPTTATPLATAITTTTVTCSIFHAPTKYFDIVNWQNTSKPQQSLRTRQRNCGYHALFAFSFLSDMCALSSVFLPNTDNQNSTAQTSIATQFILYTIHRLQFLFQRATTPFQ